MNIGETIQRLKRLLRLRILRGLKIFFPKQAVSLDGIEYDLALAKQEPVNPIIGVIIAAYLPNEDAKSLLRVAIESVEAQAGVPLSIWVVTAGSPSGALRVRPDQFPRANFIFTDSYPVAWELSSFREFFAALLRLPKPRKGSTVNGWSLDLGLEVMLSSIDKPRFVMTLQMDVMFTRSDSLEQMLGEFEEGVACVGVREQQNFGGTCQILHSLGCIWDLELFQNLGLNFAPDFPEFDVAEKAVVQAVTAGKRTIAFRNIRSHADVKLEPQRYGRFQDVTVNDKGDVLFVHLGRGVSKSVGAKKGPITVEEWCSHFEAVKVEMKSNEGEAKSSLGK